MAKQALPDTSCLILFRKIGQLELLYKVYGRLTITPEVSKEFQRSLPDWIHVKSLSNTEEFETYRKVVDYGEASLILLAMEMDSPLLIIDDKRGRKMAQALNIELTGTLGTLLRAKKQNLIPAVKPLLKDLKAIGFRVTEQLENFILEEAGEL